MADVRAMLRAERASRAPPKAKVPSKTASPAAVPASKKRKADEEDENDVRKRARSDTINAGVAIPDEDNTSNAELESAHVKDVQQEEPAVVPEAVSTAVPATTTASQQPDIDEDEWAAFERDVATPPPEAQPRTALDALNSSNAISAAPMTAEELAAQAREEQSEQRGKRDAEIEGEKEDAEQALAEEFEEMEALEERVRRLRERRESIRKGRTEPGVDGEEVNGKDDLAAEKLGQVAEVDVASAEDEDEEDDEWDDWRFRGR